MSLIERLENVLALADYPNGHVLTSDNLSLADVEAAVAALKKLREYASHKPGCRRFYGDQAGCICGLSALLKENGE